MGNGDGCQGNDALAVDADHIVALWNGGNLRADVPVGKFGAETLAEVLPYPNKVAVVYMTGAELIEALEAASQALPYSEATAAACASFMQVSFKAAAAENERSAITAAVVRDVVWMYLKEKLAGTVGADYAAPQGRITVEVKPKVQMTALPLPT